MPEILYEIFEYSVGYLSLHLRGDLIIKRELFYNQVEIMQESILYILLYDTVEIRWYIVRFI